MRILTIAHDHPDWTNGGVEIVAAALTRAFAATPGVAARLLVASTAHQRPDAVPGALEAVGGDLALRTGVYDAFMLQRRDGVDWLEGLARAVALARPDVVHLHGLDRLGAEIVPALRRAAPRARLVLTLHDYQFICALDGLMVTAEGAQCRGATPDACRRCLPAISTGRHALRRAHLAATLDGIDLFLAPGRALRDAHVAWGLDPGRVVLVDNPAPEAPPEGVRPLGAPTRFAFFGALAAHKGAGLLLDAAARLQGTGATVTLHGGFRPGDDAFRAEALRLMAAAGGVAAHHGPYAQADVVRLMRRADWIVTPSLWREGAPLVILEAQAAGRPVICADLAGMTDLVRHGVDGLCFPAGDAAAMAGLMSAVAGDRALWDRLAAAQLRRPTAAEAARRHLDLFAHLAAESPA